MFKEFKTAVSKQFDKMKAHPLFRTEASKDLMWETYLKSFPEGSNPICKERTEHDCQCCRQFIRSAGNMVAIIDGCVVSLWDIEVGGCYQPVADALSALVHSTPIANVFLSTEPKAGVDNNIQMLEAGSTRTWEHFYLELPADRVISADSIGTKLSGSRSAFDVFRRGLNEISVDSIDTVLELIDQNSLYRGEEHREAVKEFKRFKYGFDSTDAYCWLNVSSHASRIRNTVIGTLLVDLSEGKELDHAVRSYETKVAPANYQRPKSLITKGMIEKAQKKVKELGFLDSLPRRYAVTDDITINNVIFADREAKKQMGVFDELAASVPTEVKSFDKVEEVPIDTFIETILPKAESIELLVDNKHAGNMVSLVAPVNSDAPCMLKWDNNFSWAYAGEMADSVKERVKRAGGNVEGDLRCSLAWYNYDDLDLHMVEPNGNHIGFNSKRSLFTGGALDVDMNVQANGSRDAVENIVYPDRRRMHEGRYKLYVNNYTFRESIDVGFEVEIELAGELQTFFYSKPVRYSENVVVAEFDYTHANGIKFVKTIESKQATEEVWGINTQQFHRVKMVMNSPNHWDGHAIGNKHYFFMIEGCKQEGKARGFFNELLTDSLREHRKVFEVLGSKMKAEESEGQLSGLGFSSTQRNTALCRVAGSFSRVIKLIF